MAGICNIIVNIDCVDDRVINILDDDWRDGIDLFKDWMIVILSLLYSLYPNES
jgi:hypothetical protein